VKIADAFAKLKRVQFDLAHAELHIGILQQAGEVMVHIRKNHVN